MTMVVRRLAALGAGLPLLLVACSGGRAPLADELASYTDSGDGCQQVVSAISYADEVLKDMGQEQYQVFDDSVRSRISAVNGTIALEVRDFPSEEALEQARVVAELAEKTGSAKRRGQERVALLRKYRREAAQMIIVCAREVPRL